jgi:S-adenosylmethionine hydrolase
VRQETAVRRAITLTTDFGAADSWVGQVKGAILAVAPDVQVVDLCHEIAPQDVAAAAYHVEIGHRAFAPGTIHVVVVDPGVGTERRAVAVETAAHVFVAPDNGVLGRVLLRERAVRAHVLSDPRYAAASPSATFHGRDVFAPAAAWIARGVAITELGPVASDLVAFDRRAPPIARSTAAEVAVVSVDRFGNVVLDLRDDELERALGPAWRDTVSIATADAAAARFRRTYGEAAPGETFFVVGSSGYLELARREASAARATKLRPGDRVSMRFG